MVTMSEEIFHLNANALNEQIDNLAASTYLRNYLYYPADTAMRRAFSHNLHDNDLLAGRKGLQLYDETGKLLYEEGTLFPVDLKAYKAEIQAQKQGGYWLYDNEAQMIMLTREFGICMISRWAMYFAALRRKPSTHPSHNPRSRRPYACR